MKRPAGPKGLDTGGRLVAAAFGAAMVSAVAFVAVFVLWPHDYVPPGAPGHSMYTLFTPVVGLTFGATVAALAAGVIGYAKAFYPDEVMTQPVQLGSSDEAERREAGALAERIADETGLGRRRVTRRLAVGAFGTFGIVALVLALGGFVRRPWTGGRRAALWTTGWGPRDGEPVYLKVAGADPNEIVLARPEDMEPGSMRTVFPFRESERGHLDELIAAEKATDNPVMLIRLPPGTPVTHLPGQEGFHSGDYYAFSKLCTHLGCPASLYDHQRQIALCPCHQSEFLITESARPVFGPATRPLPQLPIAVDAAGRFVAVGDFVDPVGPGFWEMRTGRG